MADKAIHARLVVHDLDKITPEEKKTIVTWLYSQIAEINYAPQNTFASRFTARLFKK